MAVIMIIIIVMTMTTMMMKMLMLTKMFTHPKHYSVFFVDKCFFAVEDDTQIK